MHIGRRAFFSLFVGMVLIAAFGGRDSSIADGAVVTLHRRAALRVPMPNKREGFLDIHVRSYTPPARGGVEAVVTIRTSDREIEIGRFTFYPNEAFSATNETEERVFRLDAKAALSEVQGPGPLLIHIGLEPIGESEQGDASLLIGTVRFVEGPE